MAGAEGIIDEDVDAVGQGFGQRGIVLGLARLESDVLEKEGLAVLEAGLQAVDFRPDDVGGHDDVPADKLGQALGYRGQAHFWIGLALGAAQVRGQHELGAAAQEIGDGGKRGLDPLVVADGPVFIQGDVEVHP